MNITDLAQTNVYFKIEGDSHDYWNFTFYAYVHDDYEYIQSMNKEELAQLRLNCKKILEQTENL